MIGNCSFIEFTENVKHAEHAPQYCKDRTNQWNQSKENKVLKQNKQANKQTNKKAETRRRKEKK